jgi:predicted amidohydrolase YtcJ
VRAAQPEALLLRGGVIFTNDPAHPRARSIYVERGMIAALDDEAERRGAGARIIALDGRTVLPALTDAHAHLYGLGLARSQVDMKGCASEEACAERVGERSAKLAPAAATGELQWITGRGWDQNLWPGARFPEHAALDRVAPDRPVWLHRVDGHAGWANRRALELAGVTSSAKDPAGGRILRDTAGAPTGVLVDEAMALVEHVIPEPSLDARERLILDAQTQVLAAGLTSIHEMGIGPETIAAYRALDAEGRLAVRVHAYVDGAKLDDSRLAALGPPDRAGAPRELAPHFVLSGIKLFADGALGSRGAALLAPYSDDPGNRGIEITNTSEIEAVARRALAAGWQVAVHAIGDRANRSTLDAFSRAGVTPEKRFRIEHAQVVAPEDLPRFGKEGVIASIQPTHATSDAPWAEARIGAARMKGAYAWRRLIEGGARLAAGSDFPVEDVAPVGGGLWASVTRTDHEGRPNGGFYADQVLTLDEAVAAFSRGAAYAAFEESWRGRAAAGQAADLTVLDRDITKDSRMILAARVDLTIVGGRVAYERKR